ncbi:M20 family peptidase [Caproiciproducens sp. NJN-50]|uniref:Sapep family Mn(2+)-dependent dipeptidase n=1 Tax=Acutalibacteraceae TaxID=3082771 RepID=UPI000FFE06AE|nr:MULTISPECIES: Sapep family Mn(2+)-dependent dipeptidase [Acutalibacteraceae]QAT50064.1 M20 family peptidase [Caproiciproducens sp. NJN-50]
MDQKRIENYFSEHEKEMLRDICTLVRIPSDKGEAKEGMPYGEGPAKAMEAAAKLAESHRFSVGRHGNRVITIDLNGKPRQLDILAHLDVVPGGNGWTVTQPFEPLLKGGRLYGRGAADDKGPAVAALYAMMAVRDLGVPLTKNARLVLGGDEECGSSDMAYYYQHEPEAPMTFSPDAAFPVINIEKGRFGTWVKAGWEEAFSLPRIVSAHGGVKNNVVPDTAEAVLEGIAAAEASACARRSEEKTGVKFELRGQGETIRVTAHGSCAHASTPGGGNNAVTGLITFLTGLPLPKSESLRALRSLNALFPHGDWSGTAAGVAMRDEISGDLTLALDLFEYGPTGLKAYFDGRTPVCATNENLRDKFFARAAELGLNVEKTEVSPAHHVPADSPFVRTLLRCYEQYSGRKGECVAIGGGTYCHHLKNGVGFGCSMPGTENRMHGADEFAVVKELLLGAEIFAQAIIDLCS